MILKKKRICRFCEDNAQYIDFRDEKKIMRFTTEQGKIIPRRTSGTCAKHQRLLVKAIKRARHLALIPYVAEMSR
ncbi:MAG: 30S ribosomal protein S18 [bacterium]|nr:30S ribosomal protein S18 [candidate division KSB1 bacterium]MCU0645249.1 30S ribosomal protein S18 [bacterium]